MDHQTTDGDRLVAAHADAAKQAAFTLRPMGEGVLVEDSLAQPGPLTALSDDDRVIAARAKPEPPTTGRPAIMTPAQIWMLNDNLRSDLHGVLGKLRRARRHLTADLGPDDPGDVLERRTEDLIEEVITAWNDLC